MAATKERVPRRNRMDTALKAIPSDPPRSASTVLFGRSVKTRLITNSTPTSAERAKALTRKATRPKVPVRRPTARYRAVTKASARICASGAISCVKAEVGMSSARLAALISSTTALPQPAAAPMR
jgi:hypothetical protein